LGWKSNFNIATLFIDFFVWVGWAYDCKKVPQNLVIQRRQKCGDTEKRFKNVCIDYLQGCALTSFPIWLPFFGRLIFAHLNTHFGLF
jgi:hypothetical protein